MAQFELNYGKGLIELFMNDSGGFSLLALITNAWHTVDTWMFGTLLGAAVLLTIWMIYQKTDAPISVYFVVVMGLMVLQNTIFAEVSTIFFYVIVLTVAGTIYTLIRGRS